MPGDDEALRQELLLARSVEPPERLPRPRPRAEPVGPDPRDGAHPGPDAPHAHPPEEGAGRVHGRRVPPHRLRGLLGPRGHPRAGPRPRRSQARQRHGRREAAHASSSTSASRRSARAPRRVGPAPRPTAARPTTWRPSASAAAAPAPRTTSTRLALTLWEMWTCRVPEPGYKPRAKPMRSQIMFDVPSGLSIDEVKQIFRCLTEDPQQRPPARHMRFFNPTPLTTNPIQVPRERLDPGPPPGRSAAAAVHAGRAGAARHVRDQRARGRRARCSRSTSRMITHRPPRRPGPRHPRGDRLGHARDAPLAARLLAHRGPGLHQRHLRRPQLRAQDAGRPDARRRGAARRVPLQARELRARLARSTSARASTSASATASRACSCASS